MKITSSKKEQKLPQETITQLINLYNEGKHLQVLEQTKKLSTSFPTSLFIWNIIGASFQNLNKPYEASKAFQKVVIIDPHDYKGYNNLAVSLKEANKLSKALVAIKKSLQLKPDYAIAYNNKGNILCDLGKNDQAIKFYKKSLFFKPQYAEAYNNLGNAYQNKNNLKEAMNAYEQALLIKPDYKNALFNKGNVQRKQSNLKEAIVSYQTVIKIDPLFFEAYKNLGDSYQLLNEFEKAEAAYLDSMKIKPDYIDAHYHLGKNFIKQNKFNQAISKFNIVLSLQPKHENALNSLGVSYLGLEDTDKATQYFKKAISINSNFCEPHNNIGNILQDKGKLKEAKISYINALTINPDYAHAYNNIALISEAQGQIEEAISFFKKALFKNSSLFAAHRNLSRHVIYKSTDKQIKTVKDLINNPSLNDEDKSHLHYAYAKMNEDLGNYKIAFDNYKTGGALRNKIAKYKYDDERAFFVKLKSSSSELLKNSLATSNLVSKIKPIFILGMPRSGTTLVEQIISSHSKVKGGGELTYLFDYGDKIAHGEKNITFTKLLEFRKKYLTNIIKISNESPYVTDKMPHNFRYIGLIMNTIPEAKIIHVKRDPSATCWSNFKHYFQSKSLSYSHDLFNTVEYFKLYQSLMKFWNDLYDKKIFQLDYDKLTIDQENQIRKLINYIGLDWEEECLFPHKNKRNVQTASSQQIRKKIYTGSSNSWKNYKPYLNDIFGDFLH